MVLRVIEFEKVMITQTLMILDFSDPYPIPMHLAENVGQILRLTFFISALNNKKVPINKYAIKKYHSLH